MIREEVVHFMAEITQDLAESLPFLRDPAMFLGHRNMYDIFTYNLSPHFNTPGYVGIEYAFDVVLFKTDEEIEFDVAFVQYNGDQSAAEMIASFGVTIDTVERFFSGKPVNLPEKLRDIKHELEHMLVHWAATKD